MIILFLVLSYLLGSFPTGYILYYFSERKDIRGFGSQSTGATNMLRLKGWIFAFPVILIDITKGFLPVFLALKFLPDEKWALGCGFLAVLGHCFPIFIKFKGGKGVATAVGVYGVLAFKPLLIGVVIFLTIIILTRYVSLGSIMAMMSLPISIHFIQEDTGLTVLATVIFLLVAIRHTGNVQRLIKGKERKLGEKN